jgi:type VI secretion system secreted protein Hcp
MLRCANGQHIPEAVITLAKSGADKPIDYLRITLTDVIVSSVASSGAAGGDAPTESISLNYGKIKFEYYRQNPDGSVTLAGAFAWDILAAKQL